MEYSRFRAHRYSLIPLLIHGIMAAYILFFGLDITHDQYKNCWNGWFYSLVNVIVSTITISIGVSTSVILYEYYDIDTKYHLYTHVANLLLIPIQIIFGSVIIMPNITNNCIESLVTFKNLIVLQFIMLSMAMAWHGACSIDIIYDTDRSSNNDDHL